MPTYSSNIQIPNLPVAISLDGSEQLEIVQAGTTCRTTTQAVANLAQVALAPNYTTVQKNALSVNTGALVFDTTLQKLCVYTATGWETVTSV
jgi:hypothetical protein